MINENESYAGDDALYFEEGVDYKTFKIGYIEVDMHDKETGKKTYTLCIDYELLNKCIDE